MLLGPRVCGLGVISAIGSTTVLTKTDQQGNLWSESTTPPVPTANPLWFALNQLKHRPFLVTPGSKLQPKEFA